MKKMTLNAREIAEMLGISVSCAYELFHREDFPTLQIGRRFLVVESKFHEWLETHSGTDSDNE